MTARCRAKGEQACGQFRRQLLYRPDIADTGRRERLPTLQQNLANHRNAGKAIS
jgi:hypothetical protein